MTQDSLTEKLATHLMKPVDEVTRQRARLHLLDWLGCVAGARRSKILAASSGLSGAARKAALLGNVMEMDDVHRSAILHPGPVIWASAMMQYPQKMDVFLDGAVRGYEAMIAVGQTLDKHHYSLWHPTATAGFFGSAGAMATYLPLSETQLVWAFGNVGSVAGGLWNLRNEDVMTKQWHILHATRTGADAVQSAMNGLTGPRFILEGAQGLYEATCKAPKPMTFPERWRIHEVSFKPWGACRHAHPSIDATLTLKAKLGKLHGDIHIATYADAMTFCDRPDPVTVNDAKFSIQHSVAVVAEQGVPRLADFEPDAIEALADARCRVIVSEAPDITARYPEHYGARVTCDGESVDLVDTLGDPERPLAKDGVIDKARTLIAWGGLTEKEADRAIDLALNGVDPQAIHDMLEDWLS
ncbi:MmgE/PrpD family protein [Parasphingorhabdus sp.]|uniref:MmgE/PrpD family protein n=1 Tax=Parasphingorhabdus sp. TaxID=2709688 RepID=UPI003A942A13|tara:strand:- start:24306 stop:25544 length:1239 start_codon:yes stop_codon:yes gene_type:complete